MALTLDGTKSMQQMAVEIVLQTLQWLLVLANLWGLIKSMQFPYEERATLLLGLMAGIRTATLYFSQSVALILLLLKKTTKLAYGNPIGDVYFLQSYSGVLLI
jgi:hypothetical protein